jgi:hypothetical protein
LKPNESGIIIILHKTNNLPVIGQYITNIQLEKGTSPTSYEPFTNTLYGGYVDLEAGVVVATWGYSEIDSLTWAHVSWAEGDHVFVCNEVTNKALNYDFLCSKYKSVEQGRTNLNNNELGVYHIGEQYRNRFAIRDDSCATKEAFEAANENVRIYYQLATPITYPLTPQIIKTLKGQNTIWSDMNGNLEISYWKH